jgi:hypothetical protein
VSATNSPVVTVLVSTYNHERYIEQALTSVVEQETSFPFQVVVIEDCSTDGTRDLVRAFAVRHSEQVRLALAPVNENSNRIFATEWGSCASEYVAILDGDDYWTSPEKLQRQVEVMEGRPEYSFCFHDVTVISEGMSYVWQGRFTEGFGDGARVRTLTWLDPSLEPEEGFELGRKRTINPRELWAGCFVPGCSPLARRRLLPELPRAFVDIEFGDWALYLLLAEHGPILYLDEVLGAYRVHAGGLWSGLSRETQHRHVVTFFEQMLEVLPGEESAIKRELQRHHRLADAEHRRALRWRCIADALASPVATVDSLDAVLTSHLPPDSTLIWAEPALRPAGLNRRLLFFPPSGAAAWKPLAVGPRGRKDVPWIAPGFAYEFRLHRDDEPDVELAALTVVADRAAPGPAVGAASAESGDQPAEVAYLLAAANPANAQGTHAGTEILWSTGNGAAGTVTVASYSLAEGMPTNDEEAIAILERLRAEGGEFIFIARSCLSWLELYQGLEHYLTTQYALVLEDPSIGRLYDLRR